MAGKTHQFHSFRWIIDKLVTLETVQVCAHWVSLRTPFSLDMQLIRSPLQVQCGFGDHTFVPLRHAKTKQQRLTAAQQVR